MVITSCCEPLKTFTPDQFCHLNGSLVLPDSSGAVSSLDKHDAGHEVFPLPGRKILTGKVKWMCKRVDYTLITHVLQQLESVVPDSGHLFVLVFCDVIGKNVNRFL